MNNLSAGVQILIDQLNENPDQFFGSLSQDGRADYLPPKFAGWRQIIEEELVSIDYGSDSVQRRLPATWFMTEAEKKALADAYLQAKRQRFDAEILLTLTAEDSQGDTVRFRTTGRYNESMRLDSSGRLGVGVVSHTWGSK